MGSRRLEGRIGSDGGNFRSSKEDLRSRLGDTNSRIDVRATLQDRTDVRATLQQRSDVRASLEERRDVRNTLQERMDVRAPMKGRIGGPRDAGTHMRNVRHREQVLESEVGSFGSGDVRQLIDQTSLEPRNRQNGHQYTDYESRNAQTRSDIQVRVNNDQIPYLMDVNTKTPPDRKRKSLYYEEPIRKDMKVVIRQDLHPDAIAHEHPLRVNLVRDRESSRRMAEMIVNEALDRDYDMDSRDMLIGERYQDYNTLPFDDMEARYGSRSFERRPYLREESMPPREYFPRDDYVGRETERRSRLPTYDMDAPIHFYDKYSSPARDSYSPNLGQAIGHYVDQRLAYEDVAPRPTLSQRKSYILDTPPMHETGVSRFKDLEHRDVRRNNVEHREVREPPHRVFPPQRGKNYETDRIQRTQSSRARPPVKLPEPKNDNLQRPESSSSSKQAISKRLGSAKSVPSNTTEKRVEAKSEKKPGKPMIPKFKQVIDASLMHNVAEMTPKKKADFKMQELEVVPVSTDRSLNERFSSIFSLV